MVFQLMLKLFVNCKSGLSCVIMFNYKKLYSEDFNLYSGYAQVRGRLEASLHY